MFERFTEEARRIVFFSRYEASQYGSPYIETEHILLGLLHESNSLAARLFPEPDAFASIQAEIESSIPIREKTPTSVDLPLSHESKRVFAYAAEESHRSGDPHIRAVHLLIGLVREEQTIAAKILRARGLDQAVISKALEGA